MREMSDKPAFPTEQWTREQSGEEWNSRDRLAGGLTKREYVATHIMQGLLSRFSYMSADGTISVGQCVEDTMAYTDALLTKLSKEVKP